MYNNEKQTVQVLTYTNELDDYGISRTDTPTTRDIEMYVKVYSQTNVENPKYVDIELIGLTEDNDLSTDNQLVVGGHTYNIKFITPSRRLNQVFMVRE